MYLETMKATTKINSVHSLTKDGLVAAAKPNVLEP
jgi:hypothetical protein